VLTLLSFVQGSLQFMCNLKVEVVLWQCYFGDVSAGLPSWPWLEPSSLAGLGPSLTQAAHVVDAARNAADLQSVEPG
jgi:hypothetical protein